MTDPASVTTARPLRGRAVSVAVGISLLLLEAERKAGAAARSAFSFAPAGRRRYSACLSFTTMPASAIASISASP